MKQKTCAIVVRSLTADKEYIKKGIDLALYKGCTRFLCGLEPDTGLTAAEYVLSCRSPARAITLECVIPFEEYTTLWDERSRDRFFEILRRCDTETMLQRHYTKDCIERQRCYLLRQSDETIVL